MILIINTVDQYISTFPPITQVLLKQLRITIREAAPEAEEVISYKMPAYKFHGMLVYFAGYEKHIGFYPGAAVVEWFKDELTEYKCSKGTIQFKLDKPIPINLVAKIVAYRQNDNLQKKALKQKK